MKNALDSTISLDGINQKMESKLLGYFKKEHKKAYEDANNIQDIDDSVQFFRVEDNSYKPSVNREPA